MCGIIGYIGKQKAASILLEGLKRLEYRGYDSAGIAVLQQGRIDVAKKAGRVEVLVQEAARHSFSGTTGIGHTRWATHGGVTDANAHPHVSSDGKLALIHNGEPRQIGHGGMTGRGDEDAGTPGPAPQRIAPGRRVQRRPDSRFIKSARA